MIELCKIAPVISTIPPGHPRSSSEQRHGPIFKSIRGRTTCQRLKLLVRADPGDAVDLSRDGPAPHQSRNCATASATLASAATGAIAFEGRVVRQAGPATILEFRA